MFKQIKFMLIPMGLAISLIAGLQMLIFTFHVNAMSPSKSTPTLTIGTTRSITTLDPAELSGDQEMEILYNAGSGLLTFVPGTSELVPGLAIAMPEFSSDGLVYTFTLRSGLQFPDGTPFDADVVKWSIDRVAALGGGISYMVTEYVSQTKVIDSSTVQFVLKQPVAFFPQLVANLPYYPVSPNCFPTYQFDPNSTCGGIGPYMIVKWEHGVSIELMANPDYYGQLPSISNIILRQFNSAAEMRQALETGEIDVAWKELSNLDYQELKTNPNLNVVDEPAGRIRYLCFNTTTVPFNNANIRVALAVAMDRETAAQTVFSDTRTALYSMVSEGIWSHQDSFLELYGQRNLELAQTLLAQEGYSETNKLAVDLWYPLDHYGPLEPQFAAALASNIEETGMVSVTLHYANWYEYWGTIGSGVMPVFLLGWFPDYMDPDNLTWPFAHSSSSGGFGIFYNNLEMDTLLEVGRITTPVWGAAREEVYADIQNLWAEEAPTIPLLQEVSTAVTQDEVHGINISPLGRLPYFTIYWYKLFLPMLVRN
jgi:peptide/nickel transport system substrate-binding protein